MNFSIFTSIIGIHSYTYLALLAQYWKNALAFFLVVIVTVVIVVIILVVVIVVVVSSSSSSSSSDYSSSDNSSSKTWFLAFEVLVWFYLLLSGLQYDSVFISDYSRVFIEWPYQYIRCYSLLTGYTAS